MVTMVGTSDKFETALKDVIELEYDAIEAYKAAIERFEANDYRIQFTEFLADHNRHVVELIELAASCGAEVPEGADMKEILTKGKVVIASLVGDKAIIMAMKTNEDDTVTAYERLSKHKSATDQALPIMERALSDERRHRAWMESILKQDGKKAA